MKNRQLVVWALVAHSLLVFWLPRVDAWWACLWIASALAPGAVLLHKPGLPVWHAVGARLHLDILHMSPRHLQALCKPCHALLALCMPK